MNKMPIDVKTLEDQGTEVIGTIRNADVQNSVYDYLKNNKKSAFTQKEIADALGIRPQQARQCLHALLKKGKVARKACDVYSEKTGKTMAQIHWTKA